MSKLPIGWVEGTLNDTGHYINGMAFKPSDWTGAGLPIIRIQNLTDPHRELNRTRRKVEKRYLVETGDILVSWSATLDAFIWDREQAVLNQHIFKVIPEAELIDKDFLYHGLRLKIREMIAGEHLHGSTMKHINRGPFLAHSFAIPPLSEQRRIVKKIEVLSGKHRRASDHLDRISRLVEKYKQAILAEAFRGELTRQWRKGRNHSVSVKKLEAARKSAWQTRYDAGRTRSKYSPAEKIDWKPNIKLPSGWTWASVDQVTFLVQYGSSAKTTEDRRGVAVLRMGNIQGGVLDLKSLKFLPQNHDEFPSLLLEKGDVLFNRTNSAELVGKSAVYSGAPTKASFASYLIRLQCSGLLPELLNAYINSAFGRDWIATVVSQQVGQANVNGTKLRQLGIPIMPNEEQCEIVKRIEAAFKWIDRLAVESENASNLIDNLDQAVLSKGFQGELVPHDPSAQPAIAVLKRIRSERSGLHLKQKRASK